MLPSVLAVLIAGSALGAQARPTYICQINGKAGYSSEKINSTCRLSEMNGISEELADSQQILSKPTAINGASTTVEGTKTAAPPATSSVINEVAAPAAASAPAVTTNLPAAASSASAPAVNPNPSVVTQNNTPQPTPKRLRLPPSLLGSYLAKPIALSATIGRKQRRGAHFSANVESNRNSRKRSCR